MAISANVERILHEVGALSEDERDEFMHALVLVGDDEVSAEWREELQSRVQDMDAGRVRLIPHEEIMKSFREGLDVCGQDHA